MVPCRGASGGGAVEARVVIDHECLYVCRKTGQNAAGGTPVDVPGWGNRP